MVPENIHTHPKVAIGNSEEGGGGGGVLKAKILKGISRGVGGSNQTAIRGGSMDIFCNNTVQITLFL